MPNHVVTGDLIAYAVEGNCDAIVHGCNCFHTMGAGIALQIRQHFPEAYEADKATSRGYADKLGSYSVATVKRPGAAFAVINAYTQYRPGPQLNYAALQRAFAAIARDFQGLRIAYPRIGAGIAGGNWRRIARIIDTELEGFDHTLVELAL